MHDATSAIALVLAVGVAAQFLAWRTRLPAILLLLVAGLVMGGTGLLDPDAVFGPMLRPAVSVAVAIVLFEGGLELDVAEIREAGRVVRRLVTVGVVVTFAVVTITARAAAGMTWPVATLLGAILVVTGPTVIAPLVRHLRLRGQPASILRTEGILIDPLGALLAVVVFEVILADTPGRAAAEIAGTVAAAILAGCALGLAGALGLMWVLRRYPSPEMLENALVLGMVVAVFGAAEAVQSEAGLFAVVVMGITLGTQRGRGSRHVFEFSETLRILLLGALFVVLGARVDLSHLSAAAWGGVAVLAAALLVARPLAVILSTRRSGMPWPQRAVLVIVNPRGIVAAAVSSVFALRLAETGQPTAERLVPVTFCVIIGTILVTATVGPSFMARYGLAAEAPLRMLFVGAHPLARDIASALAGRGIAVSLVDTHRPHVRAARLAGLDAHYGSIFSEHAMRDIDLGSVGMLVAMSGNDEVNALAVQELASLVGRDRVFQVSPAQQAPESHALSPDLLGRVLFDRAATLPELEARHRRGASVRATTLTDQFDFGVYRAGSGDGSVPMFVIRPGGTTDAFTADGEPRLGAGDTVVSLGPARRRA